MRPDCPICRQELKINMKANIDESYDNVDKEGINKNNQEIQANNENQVRES